MEQPKPCVEGQGLQRGSAAIVKTVHARDVVEGNRCRARDAEVFGQPVFSFECRRDVVVGAARPSEATDRIGLDLCFARCPDVATFSEAE